MDIETLATISIDCGFKLHERLGPGLLESVYEIILCELLKERGLSVERQVPIDVHFDKLVVQAGFRADLVIEGKLLIELKSVEIMAAVHKKQVLTYLRLMDLPLGLLMNFGAATFREGMKRIVNNHNDFASSRLRVR